MKTCVDIHDRKTSLDYWLYVLAFVFDINYKETLKIIKKNNYIDIIIDGFNYTNNDTKIKIEEIRKTTKKYIENKIR